LHTLQSLAMYLHLSRDAWIGVGIGFVASVLLFSLVVWVSRRRYVIIGSSPASDMIAYQLGRIADTLDRVSDEGLVGRLSMRRHDERESDREARVRGSATGAVRNENSVTAPPVESRVPERRVSMSIFGR
jgi:hypothetical protein